MLAVLEVYVILRFMGAGFTLGGAFIVEGLTKVINLVGALNPGNFGTYEGGSMLIAKMFGVTSTTGLTLALCRRARTVFWAGVGAHVHDRYEEGRGAEDNSGEARSGSRAVPRRIGLREYSNAREQTIFESTPGRDQMRSACPLPGTVLSSGRQVYCRTTT